MREKEMRAQSSCKREIRHVNERAFKATRLLFKSTFLSFFVVRTKSILSLTNNELTDDVPLKLKGRLNFLTYHFCADFTEIYGQEGVVAKVSKREVYFKTSNLSLQIRRMIQVPGKQHARTHSRKAANQMFLLEESRVEG